jgi:hypothetical protein
MSYIDKKKSTNFRKKLGLTYYSNIDKEAQITFVYIDNKLIMQDTNYILSTKASTIRKHKIHEAIPVITPKFSEN